jgi:excisionase family DNA binding protein
MAWTVPQVAEFLQSRPKTVREMAHRGEIPGAKIGKSWRFDEDTIRDWFKNKTTGNLKAPCPSGNDRIRRTGKLDSRSLASRLDKALKQRTSEPRRNWRTHSALISGGKSETVAETSLPGMTL